MLLLHTGPHPPTTDSYVFQLIVALHMQALHHLKSLPLHALNHLCGIQVGPFHMVESILDAQALQVGRLATGAGSLTTTSTNILPVHRDMERGWVPKLITIAVIT